MNTYSSVNILLATYNSAKYLRAQVNSILEQTYHNWKLFFRDDVSNDYTIDIINEYVEKYPNKISIIDNHGISLGAYHSFMELLKSVEGEYFMFCDHDDVWLPDKIESSMNKMIQLEEENKDKPIIVHTDMMVVDKDLHTISPSFWNYSRLLPQHVSFKELVLCNSVNGCTILLNRMAKNLSIPNVEYATMHDMLLAQSVSANNGIIYPIYKATVLYRQHSKNEVGAQKRNLLFNLKKLKNLRRLLVSNYDSWNLSRNIRKYSFASYMWTKVKVMYWKYL